MLDKAATEHKIAVVGRMAESVRVMENRLERK
jgi:hypothetical protein